MFTRKLIAAGLSLFIATTVNAAFEKDQPLFSAYPNAKLDRALMYDYDTFNFPVSIIDPATEKPSKSLSATGDLYQHHYEIENASTIKVYENYLDAAKKLGLTEIFSCALDKCGDQDQTKILGGLVSVHGDVYNNWRKAYYWVGEKDTPKGKLVVAWFIGAYEDEVAVHQLVVEGEPLETGLVKVDAAYADQAATPTAAVTLSDDEKARDSHLLPRYPGAKIYSNKKVDTETITIPVAINASDKTPLKLTGDLTTHTYEIDNVSTLKVYENYKAALTNAGFSFISQCELETCGSKEKAKELGGQLANSGDVYNWYRKPYYLLAKKTQASGNVYVALFIGSYEDEVGLQQIILEERSVQTGLVSVNADQLKQQIDADGKALIYGVYFDTGKADIKPESKPTLDAIAELLKRNSDLLLYVVGHTDDTGDMAANVTLSKQRADAVVAALAKEYDVTANRLVAQGVGPYAPASNNTSDAGKQKNRRVELVKRLK